MEPFGIQNAVLPGDIHGVFEATWNSRKTWYQSVLKIPLREKRQVQSSAVRRLWRGKEKAHFPNGWLRNTTLICHNRWSAVLLRYFWIFTNVHLFQSFQLWRSDTREAENVLISTFFFFFSWNNKYSLRYLREPSKSERHFRYHFSFKGKLLLYIKAKTNKQTKPQHLKTVQAQQT